MGGEGVERVTASRYRVFSQIVSWSKSMVSESPHTPTPKTDTNTLTPSYFLQHTLTYTPFLSFTHTHTHILLSTRREAGGSPWLQPHDNMPLEIAGLLINPADMTASPQGLALWAPSPRQLPLLFLLTNWWKFSYICLWHRALFSFFSSLFLLRLLLFLPPIIVTPMYFFFLSQWKW